MHYLIADDNENMSSLTRMYLQKVIGPEDRITIVNSFTGAKKQLQSSDVPDIVISDLNMVDGSADDLIPDIWAAKRKEAKNIGLMVVTANMLFDFLAPDDEKGIVRGNARLKRAPFPVKHFHKLDIDEDFGEHIIAFANEVTSEKGMSK